MQCKNLCNLFKTCENYFSFSINKKTALLSDMQIFLLFLGKKNFTRSQWQMTFMNTVIFFLKGTIMNFLFAAKIFKNLSISGNILLQQAYQEPGLECLASF
jgi:hypothetical protein